jgi:hypothetical protein
MACICFMMVICAVGIHASRTERLAWSQCLAISFRSNGTLPRCLDCCERGLLLLRGLLQEWRRAGPFCVSTTGRMHAAFALDPPRTTMISTPLPSAAPAAAGFKDRGQRAHVPNGPPDVERKSCLQSCAPCSATARHVCVTRCWVLRSSARRERRQARRAGRITCAHGSLTIPNRLSGPRPPPPTLIPGRSDGHICQSLATEVQSCNHRGTLVFGQSRASMHTEHHHSIL